MLPTYSLKTNTLTLLFLFRFEINEFPLITTKFHEKSMLGFICTELPKKIFILELFYLQLFTLKYALASSCIWYQGFRSK